MRSAIIAIFHTAVLLCFFCANGVAQIVEDEYHHGRGGFSIGMTDQDPAQSDMGFKLDRFTLFGTALVWKLDGSLFSLAYLNATMSYGVAKNIEKTPILNAWANEMQRQAQSINVTLTRAPFVSNGYKGLELRAKSSSFALMRGFFNGDLLMILNIRAKDQAEFDALQRTANTFRPLNKTERIIALIYENTPTPLPRELPDRLPPPDAVEMGLRGIVKRIRESSEGKLPSDRTFTQEINFDQDGFVTSETSFAAGYPDVITGWGWVAGKRVNREISVPYPGGDGPYGRRMVISGEVPYALPPGTGYLYKNANGAMVDVRYGTRFETVLDDKRRPMQRKRFSNNGTLIFSQTFSYPDGCREVKTTDESGNFFSHFRYKLDDQGNVIEEQSLSDTGKILTSNQYSYKFDPTGNWIRKEAYQTQAFGSKPGKRLIGVFTRELLYFDNSSNRPVA